MQRVILTYGENIETSLPSFRNGFDMHGKKEFYNVAKIHDHNTTISIRPCPRKLDEYLVISEKTSRVTFQKFCKVVINIYDKEYLPKPTLTCNVCLLYTDPSMDFSGCLELYYTHWIWKNCSISWRDQYTRGDHEYSTIILDAMASYDTWIDTHFLMLSV